MTTPKKSPLREALIKFYAEKMALTPVLLKQTIDNLKKASRAQIRATHRRLIGKNK